MKIRFLGSCEEVGRSAILVEHKKKKILLDAGIKLGKSDHYPKLTKSDIKSIDFVILTHAHLDHSGFLPHMIALGFRGKIYATKPTRDLCQLLLADYARICKSEHKRGFTQDDVLKAIQAFRFLEYWKKTKLFGGVYVTLYRAGHILGAAGIRLQCGKKSLYYTGDFSLRESNLLNKADTDIEDFDYLIMESTYGGKEDINPSIKNTSRKLVEIINKTMKRGGKVIIPAFGVGRSQELMMIIDNYIKSGAVDKVPCYVDGMIKKASRIYRQNVLFLKEEIPKRILLAQDDPFASTNFVPPKTKDRSDVFKQGSALIVSTSGMLTGGPILYYLEKLTKDPKNTIVLVGYQAEGTPGRELIDGAKKLTLPDGKEISIKLRVEQLNFSAHADRLQLIEFVKLTKPKKIFIVHGDRNKSHELAKELKKKHNVVVPKLGDMFEL